MKKIAIFLLLATSLFAQYTRNDFKLVKTTATREFDRTVILDYLKSGKELKVNAGLLSAAHSNDTTFAADIVKLNFSRYGESICFALGQLGNCATSNDYLRKMLHSKEGLKFNHQILDALGKTADEGVAQLIYEEFIQDPDLDRDGISIFTYNLFARKIAFDKSAVKDLLAEEVRKSKGIRRFEALFAVTRLGGIKDIEKDLIAIIDSKDKINSPLIKSAAIGCLARLKSFPENIKLFNQVISHSDWRVRVEAAKALPFFSFKSKTHITGYFKLINDVNFNVARQAATSLRTLTLSKNLLAQVNKQIETVLNGKKANQVTKGELFVSYCSLNPEKILTLVKKFDSAIQDKYIFESLRNNSVKPEDAFAYLSKKTVKKEKDILDLMPTVLSFQNKLEGNKKYNTLLLDWLDSRFASVASSAAEGMDSSFVSLNKDKIKKIVLGQIKPNVNNANYYETIISMINLSEKVDADFHKTVRETAGKSKLFAIQQFLKDKNGSRERNSKEFKNLESLWKNSFAYTGAKIITEKGDFTIKFYPEYAPVSVGNFISLAKRGFYDGVPFHRVVPNFVAQTGDSTGTGFGGPGYDIVSEFSPLPFSTYYVGMASAGRDTEGSQWFVMHNIALHLYGRYTVFGKVTAGTKVIPLINLGDKIKEIKLIK